MNIICVIGQNRKANKAVETGLSNFGYTKAVKYTTEQQEDNKGIKHVSKEEFKSLIDNNVLMEYTEENGEYYGTPHPIGVSNYVATVGYDGYRHIKEIYKDQVTGVYVDMENNMLKDTENKNIYGDVEVTVDGTSNIDKIVIEVLRYISKKGRGLE